MKRLAYVAVLVAAILLTHLVTMASISIETDGDCDSAIVSVFGYDKLYGANGFEVG